MVKNFCQIFSMLLECLLSLGHFAQNKHDDSEKTGWGNYLKICTQVIGPDLHQIFYKFHKNIPSPVMTKKMSVESL
jgi:hypothetical protein